MGTATKPVLYSFWRSSCTWRVRLALNLKKIPYEVKPIESLSENNDEEAGNEYAKINPTGKVPAIQIDGHILIESLNIMSYLEETRPQVPLMPKDAYERAKVREICEIIQSEIQPLQNLALIDYLEYDAEKKKEWAQHWIIRGFTVIEKILSSTAGKYCVGDEITLADCCLIPQVFTAHRFHGVDLSTFPTILRIDRQLQNHPAFEAAHPYNQPDCPPEEKK